MKQYLTGFITAVCLTASVFMFLGAGHTHDATEIEYSSYQYGGYGTLQSKLNEIDDKMTRGLAKKIYIAGKKANKNSKAVIDDILKDNSLGNRKNLEIENTLKFVNCQIFNIFH